MPPYSAFNHQQFAKTRKLTVRNQSLNLQSTKSKIPSHSVVKGQVLILRYLHQARELIRAGREPARRAGPGEPRGVPRRRRRVDDVAHVRGEVTDRLDAVANLPLENAPPLGRADVEVPFVVRIVGRTILLVAAARLRPHTTV